MASVQAAVGVATAFVVNRFVFEEPFMVVVIGFWKGIGEIGHSKKVDYYGADKS